jgi:hypothetical protein
MKSVRISAPISIDTGLPITPHKKIMKRLILSRMFELDFFLLTLWAVELWL